MTTHNHEIYRQTHLTTTPLRSLFKNKNNQLYAVSRVSQGRYREPCMIFYSISQWTRLSHYSHTLMRLSLQPQSPSSASLSSLDFWILGWCDLVVDLYTHVCIKNVQRSITLNFTILIINRTLEMVCCCPDLSRDFITWLAFKGCF